MDTLLNWINSNELEKLRNYIRSLQNPNSILIYDEDTDLNLLHIISANDSVYRDRALKCLIEENEKSTNKPKLDINRKSGPGNDCWTASHLACCYGNLSTLEILLDHGADPELPDKNGLDTLDIATAFDQFRCVDLIRRKMKSKTFSKADLNKSCDTVFYSFKETSPVNSFPVKRVDAQVQTSGQFNNSFDSTFKTTVNDANDEQDLDARLMNLRIGNITRSPLNDRPPSSASKVLDRHREEFDSVRRLNSTLIGELNLSKSMSKTVILNELRKDLTSNISRSVDDKCSSTNRSSAMNKSSNVIRNLRNNFRDCKDATTTDDSIEPFDASVSTIALGENKELYIDNEFSVSFINETKRGLLDQLETSDSDDEQLISERLHKLNDDDLDLTIKDGDVQDGNALSNCFRSSNQPINCRPDYDTFDNDQLFDELVKFGYRPGPVNANTRSVYIKKLNEIGKLNKFNKPSKLNNKEITVLNVSINEKLTITDSLYMFSKPLRQLMTGKFDFKYARQLEVEFVQNFENEKASSKKFFNYLLLDPRITQNLCKTALEDNPQLISRLNCQRRAQSAKDQFNYQFNLGLFKLFILAIFYIGKGQGNRPYMHLYDAAKLDQNQTQINTRKKSNIKKLNKIREVWESGQGVISLHCFQNVNSVESLTRECLMIDAIGIKFLTNIQIGQNRIKNLRWTQHKKDMLGTYLLYKAYNVLLVNGERQIRKADICK